jgi:erythromycin esterase-like protein
MNIRLAILLLGILHFIQLDAQNASSHLSKINISYNDNFEGFDRLEIEDEKLFVLAEHWHNIRSVPKATMKLLRYLHEVANLRVMAIEQGASAAYMINEYLAIGDTAMLHHITRNTMFWGKENYLFFQQLRAFNETLPIEEKITVQSIDIEYKMESAIFVINELIKGKEIPLELAPTVGRFKEIFEQTRNHRDQFQGLSVMFYYDKDLVSALVNRTYDDITTRPSIYETYFEQDFVMFATMIQDMSDGLYFDYTNPNTKYKFRDRLIYGKFTQLLEDYPNKGILCVIGERHALKKSSIAKLGSSETSPIKDQVMNIRISALYNNAFLSTEIRRVHFTYPNVLKSNDATIIKHDPKEPALKAKQGFDYTLFINEDGMLTRFNKVYEGEY